MSAEDTSGVSPSPPSPSTSDTIIKMIQNNKMKIIIGAGSFLVLMMMIIIVATTTNTTKTTAAEALTEQVSLVLIRVGELNWTLVTIMNFLRLLPSPTMLILYRRLRRL